MSVAKRTTKTKLAKKKNYFSVFVFVSKILHCVPECTAFLYSSTVLLLAKSSSSLFLMAHHLNSFQALFFTLYSDLNEILCKNCV